jgi:hypothetical protein
MALLQKAYLGANPLFRETAWYEDGSPQIVDTSAAVTVTANSTAHTKGSYAELIASTSGDATLLFVRVAGIGAAATNTATLLDIATGASGSETAIFSNIGVGSAADIGTTRSIQFAVPIKIPSGTRISARIQSVVTGGKTASVTVVAIGAGEYASAPTSVDVIGGNTANSQGISFSGASGTWVEATASTSRAYRAVVAIFSAHDDTILNITGNLIEIGVGASGSEFSFGSTRVTWDAGERTGLDFPYVYLFGRNIPAGSRLAVRHEIASNPERYGFTLIGIP